VPGRTRPMNQSAGSPPRPGRKRRERR
jgi:hypothetical protein